VFAAIQAVHRPQPLHPPANSSRAGESDRALCCKVEHLLDLLAALLQSAGHHGLSVSIVGIHSPATWCDQCRFHLSSD
jgi:hypothetical protein